MNKCFIFRDYERDILYMFHVYIDKTSCDIWVDAGNVTAILALSTEDIQDFTEDGQTIDVEQLLKMLKIKPELRQHPFKDWFEFQILPRIIDEFNNFTPNDALEEISDKLEEIKDLINEQR
ncbi:MAG: hypothetical protein IJ667_07060 [Synergistaceae bacterium]|nr:hypothetical protein [Synergistaceae bacterium]